MRKFKLIKEYPGSPKLGTINGGTMNTLSLAIVDNQPEFWEEIIEKDYEVLSLIGKSQKEPYRILNPNTGLFKHSTCTYYIEELDLNYLLSGGYNIHSVKRLSDGEIFTIGDNTKYGCIDKFYIKNNYLLSTTVLESNGRYLKYLEKIKQPLFTTEDGVDIFKGDSFYTIDSNFKIQFLKNSDEDEVDNAWSTKEKAEEYILVNKPCLSLNDLKQFFPNTYVPFKKEESAIEDINTKQLENLVKSKIQQSV